MVIVENVIPYALVCFPPSLHRKKTPTNFCIQQSIVTLDRNKQTMQILLWYDPFCPFAYYILCNDWHWIKRCLSVKWPFHTLLELLEPLQAPLFFCLFNLFKITHIYTLFRAFILIYTIRHFNCCFWKLLKLKLSLMQSFMFILWIIFHVIFKRV